MGILPNTGVRELGSLGQEISWQQLLWGLVSSRDFCPATFVQGSTPVTLVQGSTKSRVKPSSQGQRDPYPSIIMTVIIMMKF